MRLAGHARRRDRRFPWRRVVVGRRPDRGGRQESQRHRGRGDRRARQDRDAGLRQCPHAYMGDRAARDCRRVDVGELHETHPRESRHALPTRGQLSRQPHGRVGPDRRRHHDVGRLVPQHHDAGARRARDRRPRRQRHPRRVRAWNSQAADQTGRPAVHPCAASARAHRRAAQGAARLRRGPRDARHGDPRAGLFGLGCGRARHPHGAGVWAHLLLAHAPQGGVGAARRLRPHAQGRAARTRPQSRARHDL